MSVRWLVRSSPVLGFVGAVSQPPGTERSVRISESFVPALLALLAGSAEEQCIALHVPLQAARTR